MQDEPVDIEPTVAAVRAIARLARFVERHLTELSPAHYRVLVAIASGEERASRVAAKLSLGKPTVSAAVDALTGRGLVSRSVVDGDGRATGLALTPAGRQALDRADRSLVDRLTELTAATGDSDGVIDALVSLGAALEAEAAARAPGHRASA